jgi:hypothetical protein
LYGLEGPDLKGSRAGGEETGVGAGVGARLGRMATLSLTAGWGVPVNAIEFSLADDGPASPASIFVTLAGTSVGRGWDCVGHNAGTYRNRISVDRLPRKE